MRDVDAAARLASEAPPTRKSPDSCRLAAGVRRRAGPATAAIVRSSISPLGSRASRRRSAATARSDSRSRCWRTSSRRCVVCADSDAIAVVTPIRRPPRRRNAPERAHCWARSGLNKSIDRAARDLGEPASNRTLVVLGDVARSRSHARSARARRRALRLAVLAPARDGGTAALARKPQRRAIRSSSAADSANAHREAARRRGCHSSSCRCRRSRSTSMTKTRCAPSSRHRKAATTRARRRDTRVKATPIRLLPLHGIRAVRPGDDLAALLRAAARSSDARLADGVLVVCQKIVSKAESRMVRLRRALGAARRVAAEDGKDPRHVEIVMRETARVVRHEHGVWIAERHAALRVRQRRRRPLERAGEGYAVLPKIPTRRRAPPPRGRRRAPRFRHLRSPSARRPRGRRDRLRRHRAALGLARPHGSRRPHTRSHRHSRRGC